MPVEFMDLPPRTNPGAGRPVTTFTPAVLDALADRPGDWARVDTKVNKVRAATWRNAGARYSDIQTAQRAAGNGRLDIYARVVES